jgi:hypothetical protein
MNAAHDAAIRAFVAEMRLSIRYIDGQIAHGTFHDDRPPYLKAEFGLASEKASYGAAG